MLKTGRARLGPGRARYCRDSRLCEVLWFGGWGGPGACQHGVASRVTNRVRGCMPQARRADNSFAVRAARGILQSLKF